MPAHSCIVSRRRGITLIESVVSLTIISVLMLGLSSSVMLGARALPSDTELGAADREVHKICNRIRADIQSCSTIQYQSSGKTIRLTLNMIRTGANGEPSIVLYELIGEIGMIRRRADAGGYEILSTSLTDYSFKVFMDGANIRYVTLRFEFDETIQKKFELFIPTPYQPAVS